MYARDTALIATPIGMVRITGGAEAIDAISILSDDAAEVRPGSGAVRTAADQLSAWFAGTLQAFDVRLAPSATAARGGVLRAAMIAIPYGETLSYGALAATIRSSPRAIGQACAHNPFPIIVPCHRVLDAAGTLGAYSAGEGPATKAWLLDHERRHAKRTLL